MSSVASSQTGFWSHHFTNLAAESAKSGNSQLDFSNAAVAVQTYAFILEACGQLAGKHVLDCGFGTGELARMCDLMGGAVDAIDLVSTRIPQLRDEVPSVFWSAADLATWSLPKNSDRYEIIVACEVLQYVDFDAVVAKLLNALTDDGRLIILIPNAACPIVRRSSSRFRQAVDEDSPAECAGEGAVGEREAWEGEAPAEPVRLPPGQRRSADCTGSRYVGVSPDSLPQRFAEYQAKYRIAYRGIRFQDDQTLVPYVSDPWTVLLSRKSQILEPSGADDAARPSNRLQIVFSR